MQRSAFFLLFLLGCAAAQAGIQFDSTRVIYPATKSEVTLKLTNLSLRTGSTASGVGVQVLNANDTQVTFNNPITYTGYSASLGGDYVIPMKARYIRTGDVAPGTANSAVEFTMAYE